MPFGGTGICERIVPTEERTTCAAEPLPQPDEETEDLPPPNPSPSNSTIELSAGAGVRAYNGPGLGNNPMAFINMDHTPAQFVNSPWADIATCADSRYITVDLGAPYMTTGATLWHYYDDNRAYCNQGVAISATGEFAGEETVVYDTGSCSGYCSTFPVSCDNAQAGDCTLENYGPTETSDGNVLTWEAEAARYVRHWCSRNSENTGAHFLEMDIHGYGIDTPAETVGAEVVHTISATQRCSGGDWGRLASGGFAYAPQLPNGEWDAAACRTMLAGDDSCSTEWFTVASNNGACWCVPAGSDCAVLENYGYTFGTYHVTTASTPGLVDVPEALRIYENTWQNVPPGGELARSSLESVAAWCAVSTTVPGWLQMDLGSSRYVAQIVTRGRADSTATQWVTQYKVQHSTDGITFTEVPALFTGNSDKNTKVYATLPEPVLARYVRLVPTAWSVHACMRAAVVLAAGYFRTSCQTWPVARAECQAGGGAFHWAAHLFI